GSVASSLLISRLTSQVGTDELRQEHRSARAGGLGFLIDESLPRGLNRADDLKMAIVSAEVAPTQGEDLPAPHPARQRQRARQLKASPRGALEQAPGDLDINDDALRPLRPRRLRSRSRIRSKQLPPH